MSFSAKEIKQLKALLATIPAKKSGSCSRPVKKKIINNCKKKSELSSFTAKELKEFLGKNKISTKKLDKKLKNDLIDLVWDYLNDSDSDSESESESDSDSESESD